MLAYTVLAASLAYQFGLERGVRRSRSFRFVVIDEAFGRGSASGGDFQLRADALLREEITGQRFVDCDVIIERGDGRKAFADLVGREDGVPDSVRLRGGNALIIDIP